MILAWVSPLKLFLFKYASMWCNFFSVEIDFNPLTTGAAYIRVFIFY